MQAETKIERGSYSGQGQIDMVEILDDSVRCLKRYGIQLLLIIIAVTAAVVTYFNFTYQPVYSAKITYAVNRTGDTAIDASIAKRLSSSIGILSENVDFREQIFQQAEDVPDGEKFWFSSQYTEGANLFTISINSDSFEYVDAVMDSFQQVYPSWADRINGSVGLETVDILQASEEPDNPYSLLDYASKGLLAGCALAVCLGAFYVQSLRTVRREKDMRAVTAKGCLTLIPETKLKKRSSSRKQQLLISNKRADWGFKQSVLTAQSRIDQQMEKNGQKVLLVTSTLPQEGKSMLSVNLALAAIQNDRKTILIDGDMRNPSVGRMFGFEGKAPGLSDYFDKRAGVDEIIVDSENLSVISAGTRNGGASEIVSGEMMQDLMAYLKKNYDFIIIDTPPSGLFSDASIFSGYADEVLYVVRYDMADIREIREGITPFTEAEKLLGYVINRSRRSFSSYGRYGKYGYLKYGRYGKYKRYIKTDESSMNTEDSL